MDSTQQAFADWRATAAYLYVLHLDPAQFAWEYLRRNPSYCRDWRDVQDPARRWGLELAEDPTRDSRTASPVWCSPRTGITIVADSNPASARFPFWDIPGNKRLCAGERGLYLAVRQPRRTMHLNLHPGYSIDQPFAYLISAGTGCNTRCRAVQELSASYGTSPLCARAPRPSTTALNHMRMLQALDADAVGATHRSIAQILVGADAVEKRWTPDGELRARVRHWVRKARSLRDGDYRQFLASDSE